MKSLQRLKNGERPVYLLHGEEQLQRREAAEALVKHVLDAGSEDFNLDRFDAESSSFSVAQVTSAAQMVPMMAARRVVWLREAQQLDRLGKGEVASLLAYIEKPSPKTCLILEARGTLDGRKPLLKALKKSKTAHLELFEPPKAHELEGWVQREAQRRRCKISPRAAQLMSEALGADLGALRGAIDRLALFAAEGEELGPDEVTALLPEAKLQTTVWRFLDTLAERRVESALAEAHALLSEGQAPLGLLALITRQLRQQLIAHAIKSQGGNEAALAKAAKVPPFAAKKLLRSCRRWSPAALLRALERAGQSERELKSSRLAPSLLVEALVIDLCVS